MRTELDRKIKVLFILLDHPGGLKFMELFEIVRKEKKEETFARGTLRKVLDELTAPPSPLVIKDDREHYVIGLVDPLLQIFSEESKVSSQADRFFQILYKGCNRSDKKQIAICLKLGNLYLQDKLKKLKVMFLFLQPFLGDSRIRELWIYSEKYILDVVYKKTDEMIEELTKIKPPVLLEISQETDEKISEDLKKNGRELAVINSLILDLINQLETKDEVKKELKQEVQSESLLKVYSEEPRTITKFIRTLEKTQKLKSS